MKKIRMTVFLFLGLLSAHAISETKVIYGDDNRKDIHQVEDALHLDLAKSTAAMVSKSSIVDGRNQDEVKITGRKLSERGICATERFAEQLSAATCSGFLVGEDLLVTAGHCVRGPSDCSNYRWVFEFNVSEEKQGEFNMPKENVFACKEVVERKLDRSNGDDYALIRLERAVTNRTPLEFRTTGKVETNDPLVVIGHPSGLPTKVAAGANVRGNDLDKYFVANLDTYGGNSGSAVFNSENGLVEGILVRGEVDYVYRDGCRVSNVCTDEGCRGEDVTRITNISAIIESHL
jgi:V8-like Glu-specific endopeptidase